MQTEIGVDEVGRGCLAGPVYAAAVILNPEFDLTYRDSKTLSASRREELSKHIHKHHKVSICIATVKEIDEINILQASFLAMKRAIEGLGVDTAHVFVDGKLPIKNLDSRFIQTAVIKGDSKVSSIAAASIVAKVARDQFMNVLAEENPGYAFEAHKGYATLAHKQAIARLGPTQHHRSTFAGVREHLQKRFAPNL